MSAASEAGAAAPVRARTALERLLEAVPIALLALLVLGMYGVEAWTRKTPWVFSDEIEWSEISRAISSTGHAARRGEPVNFKSLYAFLIAPVWWIHSTETAYAVLKYLNALVMTFAAVPTYLLARMLVTKRAALVVAFLSVAIPGMSYVTSIVPEVLAYPWYAVSSWLIVRALSGRRRLDIALAAGACGVAVLVRSPQFFTVPASFLIAAAALWVTGARGRAFRAGWSRSDTFGAIVLLAGALILFNRVVLQHVHEWQVSTQYSKNRMVDLGLRAGSSFIVGLGILPVIGGVTSLRLPERRGEPVYRAFAAYLAASIFCVALYTGVKAAYLSTIYATLTEERNLIYLAPLLLIGTALVFEARQIDWRIAAATAAFITWLIFDKKPQLLYPYFEAPGSAILTIPTRHWRWTVEELRWTLLGVVAISLVVLAVRRVRAVAAVVVVLGAAWMLTSEIAATVGTNQFADRFRNHLPATLDWIDQDTGGRSVTYLGQAVVDPNGVWLTEFWNRSIKHVNSLDGSAPGPGPTYAPDVVRADGLLSGMGDIPYVVADNGVALQAKEIDHWNQLRLYERTGPWRLLDSLQQVYSDGWAPGWSTYTYFKKGGPGTVIVQLGRPGFNGDAPPGRALLKVGTVKIVNGQAQLGRVVTRRRTVVTNGSSQLIRIPVAHTPVRVEIFISPTFRASTSDTRNLGAQVGFAFKPAT